MTKRAESLRHGREFASFVESKMPLTASQLRIVIRYGAWRASGKQGNSRLSLVPGGKAVQMLERLWDQHQQVTTP